MYYLSRRMAIEVTDIINTKSHTILSFWVTYFAMSSQNAKNSRFWPQFSCKMVFFLSAFPLSLLTCKSYMRGGVGERGSSGQHYTAWEVWACNVQRAILSGIIPWLPISNSIWLNCKIYFTLKILFILCTNGTLICYAKKAFPWNSHISTSAHFHFFRIFDARSFYYQVGIVLISLRKICKS